MKSTTISRSFLVFLISLFILMMSTLPASAKTAPAMSYTFTVNTTADTHDAHPGDGVCADQNGQCSLRAAIEEADALPSGSSITITVPAGTYGLTLGSLSLTANTITINGAAKKTTIIKGNQTFEILSVSSASSAQISKLTIEGGNSSSFGGGIDNGGTLTVSESAITNNIDSGIYNGGTLTVSNSSITANSDPYGGGGIYNDGVNGYGTLTISNSTISGNTSIGANSGGGGIYNVNYATVSVTNSTISGNRTTNGGGAIYTFGYHGGSNVTVSNSTISGNSALFGGALEVDSSDVIVSNSTLSGNLANGGDGGAIDFPDSNGGSVTVSNSTFSGNSATGKGAVIAYNNINGPVTFTATIIANSKGASNGSGQKIMDKGYNLDSGTSCRFKLKTDLNNTDPMLASLRHNGGPTKTMALRKGSKAIDWVAKSSCPATDQRGHKRPDGSGESACDIGAYESAY